MSKMPAVFVNHGGGPLPLLNRGSGLSTHLSSLGASLKPTAIVIFSAHWEENVVKITSGATHPLLFDYGGFPKQCYSYQYPAPGDPTLAAEIRQLLKKAEIPAEFEEKRGWDHGVFVPLLLMFPAANIPVVAVSLHASLEPALHSRIGASLQSLRDRGILLLGSGYTFHNMRAFGGPSAEIKQASKTFDGFLRTTLAEKEEAKRREALTAWKQAPGALLCHPREEHLVPLFVISGAGGNSTGQVTYSETDPFHVTAFTFE